jgi:hypothetical protein
MSTGPPGLRGACHCGAVSALIEGIDDPVRVQVRACRCGFCRRHGAVTFAAAGAQARLSSRGRFLRYRFGSQDADFLLCPHCGVYVGAVLLDGQRWLGTLNAAGLQLEPLLSQAPKPVDYEGESALERRARRLARWMPVDLEER